MLTVEERVANGAQLLDERRPGWYEQIDLKSLDIAMPCECICGQLGEVEGVTWMAFIERALEREQPRLYEETPEALDEFDRVHREWTAFLEEHGFDGNRPAPYKELTAEWKRVILARREHDRLPAVEVGAPREELVEA